VEEEAGIFVLSHLLSCFKMAVGGEGGQGAGFYDPTQETTEAVVRLPFIGQEAFAQYLEELDYCEVPETVLLQKFEEVATRLAQAHLCLIHHQNYFSNMTVSFVFDSTAKSSKRTKTSKKPKHRKTDQPHQRHTEKVQTKIEIEIEKETEKKGGKEQEEQEEQEEEFVWKASCFAKPCVFPEGLEVRFFLHRPLLDLVETYFVRNIPGEFWLPQEGNKQGAGGLPPSSFMRDPSVQRNLVAVVHHMNQRLVGLWEALMRAIEEGQPVIDPAHKFFWLLEEWVAATKLLGNGDDATAASTSALASMGSRSIQVPSLELRLPSAVSQSAVVGLLCLLPKTDTDNTEKGDGESGRRLSACIRLFC
jgi:hypothetical protein